MEGGGDMPYCRKCGAYIPDGWDHCPSCGTADNGGTQAQYQYQQKPSGRGSDQRDYGEEIRKGVEDYLNKKRQESKQWAQDEYRRRQTEQTQQGKSSGASNAEANKLLSILSYISGLFILPFVLRSDTEENKSVRFHAKQGGILFAVGMIAQIVGKIFGLGWLVRLLRLGFTIKGASNAANGKDEPLPYIGKIL